MKPCSSPTPDFGRRDEEGDLFVVDFLKEFETSLAEAAFRDRRARRHYERHNTSRSLDARPGRGHSEIPAVSRRRGTVIFGQDPRGFGQLRRLLMPAGEADPARIVFGRTSGEPPALP